MARTLKLDEETRQLSEQVHRLAREKHRPALVVMSGPQVGIRVSVQGNLLIGRDPDASLMLLDQGVSWHHAMVQDRAGAWTLVDMESTNGVLVNGKRVVEADLHHGDKVMLGETTLRFEVQDGADAAYSEVIAGLVQTDDLTGLYLRRRFDSELAAAIVAGTAASRPVALLAMDMDGLKAINDTHGHLFGAHAISETGKLIGEILGEAGFACRFGGDEFIAALPGKTLEEAAAMAEEIRARVADHPFVHEGKTLAPRISIGVAVFPDDAKDAGGLFQRADEALYLAKRTGKNRVCRHSDVLAASPRP